MTQLKACGLRSKADLESCREADYHGFILRSPSPRCLDLDNAAELMEMSGAKRVVVTTEPDPLQVRVLTEALRPDVLQVHSLMTPAGLQMLRQHVPEIWALVPVGLGEERERLMELTGSCDGIVFDTASSRGGGSGRTHDWGLSARLRAECPSRVVLAGGLGPQNVGDAVRKVRPDVIDVSSGIERAGRKDPLLFSQMISAIRRVDDEQR